MCVCELFLCVCFIFASHVMLLSLASVRLHVSFINCECDGIYITKIWVKYLEAHFSGIGTL